MTISSQAIPLAAWSLLLSQRQQFLNNYLAQVPVSPNQQGTHDIRDDVLSSLGAHDMGIDTPFSPTAFDDLEMGGSVENPILQDEEEDMENCPPPPTTPVSETPTRPLHCWKVVHLEQE